MRKIISTILLLLVIFSCATRKIANPVIEEKPDITVTSGLLRIPAETILNQYLSKAKMLEKDSLIFPINNDSLEDYSRMMIIGKFIDGQKIYAIDILSPEENTKINYYSYDLGWKKIGSDQSAASFGFHHAEFYDLNGDNRNEIVLVGFPNMNGNSFNHFYYYSSDTDSIKPAGSYFGVINDSNINREKNTLDVEYGGSWYGPEIKTRFIWRNDKLVPQKKLSIELKIADMRHAAQWIEYYENPTYDQDTLVRKFKRTYRNSKKQQYMLEHFFD